LCHTSELLASARKLFAEPPYQAVCEGIIAFGLRHQDITVLVMTSEGELNTPSKDRSSRCGRA
jgi:hypothetical protein